MFNNGSLFTFGFNSFFLLFSHTWLALKADMELFWLCRCVLQYVTIQTPAFHLTQCKVTEQTADLNLASDEYILWCRKKKNPPYCVYSINLYHMQAPHLTPLNGHLSSFWPSVRQRFENGPENNLKDEGWVSFRFTPCILRLQYIWIQPNNDRMIFL